MSTLDPTTARRQLAERERIMQAVESRLFARQLEVINSPKRFHACHPGRRSGKSHTIPHAAVRAACLAGPGAPVLIGAEELKKAKALYWSDLIALDKTLGLGWRIDSQASTITTPWGAWIQLVGAKDVRSIELLRGFKPYEAHWDEVGTYYHLLRRLTFDVLEPALGDCRHEIMGGRLFLWGTPSYSKAGYWYELCSGQVPGWTVWHWTVRDNPHYPDPEGFLAEVRGKNGWDEDDPTYVREYEGRFVNAGDRLVYRYSSDRNGIVMLPQHYDRDSWIHTIGVDFGVRDACAWGVWASAPHETSPYLVFTEKSLPGEGLLPDQASERTARLVDEYDPDRLVGDAGGLGKPYIEDWNRRRLAPILMEPAEKTQKRGAIEILNNDLRTGRAKVLRTTCQEWIDEATSLTWADDEQLKEDPRQPNHACDAVLYAHREHRSFLANESAPERSHRDRRPGEPEWLSRWRERQQERFRSDEYWDDAVDRYS